MSEDKLELMRQMVAQLNQAADAYYDGKAEQNDRLRMGCLI